MATLVTDLLGILQGHPLVRSVRVLRYDETLTGRVELKVRGRLVNGQQLQVWLHQGPTSQDYAYQLFSDRPLLRWDNAPHYPALASAPHHFHDEVGNVLASPLSGEPLTDVPRILEQIDAWIAGHRQIPSHPGGR